MSETTVSCSLRLPGTDVSELTARKLLFLKGGEATDAAYDIAAELEPTVRIIVNKYSNMYPVRQLNEVLHQLIDEITTRRIRARAPSKLITPDIETGN